MNALWIILGLGVVVAIARLVGWVRGQGRPADLGFVSHQWVAEHRLSQEQSRER